MPNRYLREDILTSEAVDVLGDSAECFYRRLMSKVDDYGRFDARPQILKANCYPLRPDLRVSDISHWLASCVSAGVVAVYQVDGKSFGVMHKLGEPRAKASKYPPPPTDANICSHKKTYAPPSSSITPSSSPASSSSSSSSFPITPSPSPSLMEAVDELHEQVREFFGSHSKLMPNARDESIVKKMVLEGGWGDTKAAFDEAFAQAASKPVHYAQTVLTNQRAKRRLAPSGGGGSGIGQPVFKSFDEQRREKNQAVIRETLAKMRGEDGQV